MRKKQKKIFRKSYDSPEYRIVKKLARFLLLGSFLSFVLATFLTGFPVLAFLWNTTFPSTVNRLSDVLSKPVGITKVVATDDQDPEKVEEITLPEKDLSLPKTPTLVIKKIGVETEIVEAPLDDYDFALDQGVWRVPNFGTPLEKTNPIILVAHRFGYVSWSQDFREKNSFYNLPKLDVGDQIEIIWDQRKFTYEIYQKEEAEEISHYSADLILYTCRFYNSEMRIFRYARLIK